MDMVGRLDELDLKKGAPICGLFPRSEEGTPYALAGIAGRRGWDRNRFLGISR